MRAYKNLYIDGVFFHNEAEVDQFLKEKAIEGYKLAVKNFVSHHTYEASRHCDEIAERLHKVYGMSYDDIDDIEQSVWTAELS